MYVSRFFAYKILHTNSKIKIFFDAILDLIVAIILLYLLAQTLFSIVEYTNIYFIQDKALFIPIESYKTQLLVNPFQKDILWITLMFISTLIPTILHLFLATYALLAYWITKPHLHSLSTQLIDLQPNDKNYLKKEKIANKLVLYRLSSLLRVYFFIGATLLFLLGTLILMLIIKKGLYAI
jgi:hypothetical protein